MPTQRVRRRSPTGRSYSAWPGRRYDAPHPTLLSPTNGRESRCKSANAWYRIPNEGFTSVGTTTLPLQAVVATTYRTRPSAASPREISSNQHNKTAGHLLKPYYRWLDLNLSTHVSVHEKTRPYVQHLAHKTRATLRVTPKTADVVYLSSVPQVAVAKTNLSSSHKSSP